LNALEKRIKQEFPQANILGMKAPPMVSVADITNNSEIQADLAYISSLRPHFIWIGISSPKQDFLMHHASSQLSTGILLGIGGVFNYLAYPETKSPEWMKRLGLRWLYRALREPRRLAGKYMGMLAFIITKSPRIVADILRQRRQRN